VGITLLLPVAQGDLLVMPGQQLDQDLAGLAG